LPNEYRWNQADVRAAAESKPATARPTEARPRDHFRIVREVMLNAANGDPTFA
jgi:hypothetical protein